MSFREFIFRGLLFESEASRFQKAGIKVGADLSETEETLLHEALEPFGIGMRNNALQMARLYAVLHCFENQIRNLIRDTLEENIGADWYEKLPQKIQNHVDTRKKSALKESWLEGEKHENLSFLDFGHLSDIIVDNWTLFEDIIPNQHWLKQRMDELEKARNFVAHNRTLQPNEFQRIYMYISDWNKVIGL